ncbi:MAG: hypothetical protein O3C63_08130, partial [Cyanobacteria bacterium]|nr:hypothetical protein [Cyanobacteriota bacterium]
VSTGDAAMQFSIVGDAYAVGIDNSDNDNFKISYAATAGTAVLGTNDRLTINSSGNIGIGDTSPAAKLQVNGDILMGDSSATCDGTTEGSQRYNSTDKRMEFCDGTSWRDFASSGKPSFFHAHRNGTDLTTLTQNTDYTIDWTTEAYDYNSEFDLSTEKFTPTSEGIYLIVLKTRVLAVDADSFAIAKINLNGTTVAHNVETIGSSSVAASVTAVYLVHMNGTTDYVTGVVRHNSSSTKDLSGLATDTYMMGFRVMD